MNLDIVINTTNILLSLQSNFNKNVCDQIFDIDSDHLYLKWIGSNGNILSFISRLDDINKLKILKWTIIDN